MLWPKPLVMIPAEKLMFLLGFKLFTVVVATKVIINYNNMFNRY